jgi:hypothetical protein
MMENNEHNLDKLEKLMEGLKPAPASDTFLAKMRVSRPAHKPRLFNILVPLAWAAGISILIGSTSLLVYNRPSAASRPMPAPAAAKAESHAGLKLDGAIDWVIGCKEVAVWKSPSAKPYRVVQCLSVRASIWRNPVTGKQVVETEPRQKVMLVPMDTV